MSPSVLAISRMVAPIVPGPAISGVASGKTEMSSRPAASACSDCRRCHPARLAREYHVYGDQKQQDAAGNTQSCKRDSQHLEEGFAGNREQQQHARGHEDAACRDRAAHLGS